MLDRGQEKDWFGSPEIMIEAVVAGLGFYLFIVHLFTTRKQPFLQLALFRDVNITLAMVTMLGVGATPRCARSCGEGAGMLNLCRNVGSAIGTSVTAALLVQNQQIEHSVLSKFASPLNRALDASPAAHQYLDPFTRAGAQLLNNMIDYQSSVIAYVDDYKFLMLMTLPLLVLFFIMRRPRQGGGQHEAAVMD